MRLSKQPLGKDVRLADDRYPPLSESERNKLKALDDEICNLVETLEINLELILSSIQMMTSKGLIDNEMLYKLDCLKGWQLNTADYLEDMTNKVEIIQDEQNPAKKSSLK